MSASPRSDLNVFGLDAAADAMSEASETASCGREAAAMAITAYLGALPKGHQDPSVDLENVNAAYREAITERDEAREALRALSRSFASDIQRVLAPLMSRQRATILGDLVATYAALDQADALLEGGERTHILVPREALAWASATAKDLAAMQRETEPGADPADYLKGHSPADHEAWAETFAAAERGEHVEWPDRDTQEGR